MPFLRELARYIIELLGEAQHHAIRLVIVVCALTGCIIVYIFQLARAVVRHFQVSTQRHRAIESHCIEGHMMPVLEWQPTPQDFAGPEWTLGNALPGDNSVRKNDQSAPKALETNASNFRSGEAVPESQQQRSTLTGDAGIPKHDQEVPVRLKKSAVTVRRAVPAPMSADSEVQLPVTTRPDHVEVTPTPTPGPVTNESDAYAINLAEARAFQNSATKSRSDTRITRRNAPRQAFPLAPNAPRQQQQHQVPRRSLPPANAPRGPRLARANRPAQTVMLQPRSTSAPTPAPASIIRPAGWIPPHKRVSMAAAQAATPLPALPEPEPTPVRDAVRGPLLIEAMMALRPNPPKAKSPAIDLPSVEAVPLSTSLPCEESDARSVSEKEGLEEPQAPQNAESEKQVVGHALAALDNAVADFAAKDDTVPPSLTPPASSKLWPTAIRDIAHSTINTENKRSIAQPPASFSSTSYTTPQTAPMPSLQSSYIPSRVAYQPPLLGNVDHQTQADAINWPAQLVQHPAIPNPPSYFQAQMVPSVPPGFSPMPSYIPVTTAGFMQDEYLSEQARQYYSTPPTFSSTAAFAPVPEIDCFHNSYNEQPPPFNPAPNQARAASATFLDPASQSQHSAPVQSRAAFSTLFIPTSQSHDPPPVQRRAASLSISKAIPIVKPPTKVRDTKSQGMLLSLSSNSERAGTGKACIGKVDGVAAFDGGDRSASISNEDTLIDLQELSEGSGLGGKMVFDSEQDTEDGDVKSMFGEASEVGSHVVEEAEAMDAWREGNCEDEEDEQIETDDQPVQAIDNKTVQLTHQRGDHQPSPSKLRRLARKAIRDALNDAWQERESCRIKLTGGFSLERAEALEQSSIDYNSKRQELLDLMNDGKLNAEDAKMFPVFSKRDMTPPKFKVKPRQPAPESGSSDTEAEISDNDRDDDAQSDAELAVIEAERCKALEKARTAQGMLDKALAYKDHHCLNCNARYCTNKHNAKASAKVHHSTEHYRRSRAKLVEAFGGFLPDVLEAELPPVGRC